jgi:hypothetical protein
MFLCPTDVSTANTLLEYMSCVGSSTGVQMPYAACQIGHNVSYWFQ